VDDQGTNAGESTSVVDLETPPAWAQPDDNPRRRRVVRLTLGAVVLMLVAVWGYALYQGNQPLPDRMDDAQVAMQAEQICSVAVATNKALPPAYEAKSADERADVLDQSDVTLTAMVDQLDALKPTTARDIGMWTKWVADWRTYLGDRARFIAGLRVDPNTRFNVTMKDKDQVTEPIDRFSRSNQMLSCATPQDLG
jgi:hypothetical protein